MSPSATSAVQQEETVESALEVERGAGEVAHLPVGTGASANLFC